MSGRRMPTTQFNAGFNGNRASGFGGRQAREPSELMSTQVWRCCCVSTCASKCAYQIPLQLSKYPFYKRDPGPIAIGSLLQLRWAALGPQGVEIQSIVWADAASGASSLTLTQVIVGDR